MQVPSLTKSDMLLRTYSGAKLPVLGIISVDVHCNDQTVKLPLVVVQGGGPSLFGRDWLQHIQLDWRTLSNVSTANKLSLSTVLTRHTAVFKDELGRVRGTSAKLHVDTQARPRFFKPRAVPYAIRGKV